MMLEPGQRLAGWRIERILGEGGMGVVYVAHDEALDRLAAIKLIRPELGRDPAFHKRFDRERKAHASLDHRNIVDIYSSGESEHGLYVAMRLIDGPSLDECLARGPLGAVETLRVLTPIADALDYAHSRGPIHRDLKPQNILLDRSGRPFLTDFGLAWVPGQSRMTTTGAFMGTTAYASPEQLRGKPVEAASDVYSLTCVLYECLVGEVPFPRDSELATAFAHASDERPRPSAVNPALPETLDPVIARAMATDPSQRHPTAAALLAATGLALGLDPGAATVDGAPASPPPGQRPQGSRTRTGAPPLAPRQHATTHAAPPLEAPLGDPVSPPPQRQLRRPIPVLAVAALALGLFLGYRADRGGSTSEPTERARSAAVALRFPAGWREVGSARSIEGLRFREPLFLREEDGAGGELSAGLVEASGKLLLPAPFLTRLPAGPPQREAVRTASGLAYRYPRLRPRGESPLDLYVLPTTAGVATVACAAVGAEARAACERIATSLELRRDRAWPLGPGPAYGGTLDRTLSTLERNRARALRKMGKARTAFAQEVAAGRIEAVFEYAAGELRTAEITPQSAAGNAALVAALERAAAAYGDLGTAARWVDSERYAEARALIAAEEAAVERSVQRLRRLGYVVDRPPSAG